MKRILCILLTITMLFSYGIYTSAVENILFTDVDFDSWYADAVTYVSENDLMLGTAPNIFSPDGMMTRAMFATVIYRMENNPSVDKTDSFDDTEDGKWYSDAVNWASNQGIVNGYSSSVFGVNDPITREQIVTMLYRYSGTPSIENTQDFSDMTDVSAWALNAVKWAQSQNIIDGRPGNVFDPASNATRAECAAIIYRYLTRTDVVPNNGKTLIVYFSWSSNTERMANTIREQTGGDLIELIPVTAYPTDYTACTEVALAERDNNARPAIQNLPASIDEYDTIMIGYPIWWHTAPMIIGTFLESYDLTGVDVYPFTQSASMDRTQFNNSMEFVRNCAGGATVHDGLFARYSDSDSITSYLRNNNLIK